MATKTFLKTVLTICAVIFLLAHLTFAALPKYEIIDLGTLGGDQSAAKFINDRGQIVGSAYNQQGNRRATLFDSSGNGNNTDLGTLGGINSGIWSINDSGQIVGYAENQQGYGRATLFDPTGSGNNIDLGTLGGDESWAISINDRGQIVGSARNGQGYQRATLFDPTGGGKNIDLGTLGGIHSQAWFINDSGQIVGNARNQRGNSHATLFDPTGSGNNIDLGTLGGNSSNAHAINNPGQIVGWAANPWQDNRATLFDTTGGGKNIELGTLGGRMSWAHSINDLGQVVGAADDRQSEAHATLFDPTGNGKNIDLNTIVNPGSGWVLTNAFCINNHGWIVGNQFNQEGQGRAFLMKPLPRIIYVDDDAAGANDGSSWADAFNYLQDALTAAWSGDEIHVAQGIYKPDQGAMVTTGDRAATFELINGVAIKGGYAGIGTPDPDARRINLYDTILSGDLDGDDVEINNPADLLDEPTRAENSCHVITGSGTDETAVLDGFTITGGSATDPVNKILENYWGAGMSNHYGSPTVNNCTFIANLARNGGGGMDNFHSNPNVINCAFRANATRGGASGMQNRDDSSPIVTGCTFSKNYSINHGAAMRNDTGSSPTLVNCLFNDNVGRLGAAMYISSYLGQSDPIIINCTFSANAAVLYGGGIYIRDGSNPTLVNCVLWDNSDGTGSVESAQIYVHSGEPAVNYTCVQGWTGTLGGTGNIGNDPLFADAANADYHLKPGSPCINAGDPDYIAEPNETDLDGRPRIIFGRIDMGAYEMPILAEARILPQTINLASKGNWITAYIWLPDEYDIADIELVTTRFAREDVQPILGVGNIDLTITGRLTDGTIFEGTDTIKVIDKAGKN